MKTGLSATSKGVGGATNCSPAAAPPPRYRGCAPHLPRNHIQIEICHVIVRRHEEAVGTEPSLGEEGRAIVHCDTTYAQQQQ